MNAKNIVVGICCFSFSSYSFGIKIDGKEVLVRNRNDMKKVYKIITPLAQGQKEKFAEILAKAYIKYADTGKNLDKDQKDNYFWPYLGNISRSYVKYEGKNKQERIKKDSQFRTIKAKILSKFKE
jgi:hypothetical protein